MLATHADRKQLFLKAGKQIVELTKRLLFCKMTPLSLPRSISLVQKSDLKMPCVLDIAMGGSTNTVLHLLAA